MSIQKISRADSFKVVEILSEAQSTTLPEDAESVYDPIYPEKVSRLGYPLAELQKVVWETYKGVYGSSTLLKEVEYSTATCNECGGTGWKDEHGDTVCDGCGLVMNETPMIVPEDDFSNRTGDHGDSGYYVHFSDNSGPALNQNVSDTNSEPDVQ